MRKLKKLKLSQIEAEITVCPYCMDESHNKTGCCGESSAHFETAYVTQDETFLDSEVELIDDALESQNETKPIFVVLQLETDDAPAIVVNAFESQSEAEELYQDENLYLIHPINLNLKVSK